MSLRYRIQEDLDKDFELHKGDYVLDKNNDNIYVVSIIGYGNKDYALISMRDGSRWSNPSTIEQIKETIVTKDFRVYRKADINVILNDEVY